MARGRDEPDHLRVPEADGRAWDGLDEFDSPAEVVAAATTQRRIALGYAVVFLLVTFAVPLLTLTLPWWSEARLLGGMTPSFVVAAVGLYLFFLALAVAASTLARSVEDRMLGSAGTVDTEVDG